VRELAGKDRIERFMGALGAAATGEARVYFTGGATAVLLGWRDSTIDVDIEIVPDQDAILRMIPNLKESLRINVELASPAHFIPELPGWRERSVFVAREGKVSFYHYDLYAQALSKVERGHVKDRTDLESMLRAGLIDPARLRELFESIVPQMYRYPALDAVSFRRALDEALKPR
jgi:hypothetical protein